MTRSPWYYGWNIVAAGVASQAITLGILIFSFTLWVTHWARDFGVGVSDVMLIFVVLNMVTALVAPVAGQFLDRFPARLLMLISACALSGGLFLASLATSIWQIVAIYGILMVVAQSWAGVIPATTLAARWFDRRRGLAIGITAIGTSLGGLLMPPLVASLQESFGWREANQILAVISLVSIAIAALFVLDSPDKAGVPREGYSNEDSGQLDTQAMREWTSGEALKSRVFWAIGLSFLALSFSFHAVNQNFAPIGANSGMEPTTVAWNISVMAFVMILAKLGTGFLADRISYRYILGLSVIFMSAAIAMFAFVEMNGFAFLVAVISLGLGMGAVLPMFGLVIASNFGAASFGRIQGIMILVQLPAALGPLFAAEVFEATGTYRPAWIGLLTLMVLTSFLIRSYTRKPRG